MDGTTERSLARPDMMETGDPHLWWQTGVIYQVYPRSFQDSNGDGVGDLPGITARLDHLVDLGVDAVWISPIYPSPMADFGYDVADYCAVHPLFGSLDDLDRLVEAAHARGLKVILDYVPNHCSDQHPWFLESRSSRQSPKRDWFVWCDGVADGGPPNNWLSEFGGSAWQWDAATGQYYYHAFLAAQPDLNWRNPAVVAAMVDVLRFWMDRGVDGFRVDAIHHLFEDERLADNPGNPNWHQGQNPNSRVLPAHTIDQPEVITAVAGMRKATDAYADRVLIGEAYLPVERLMAYYGIELDAFHLPFNFHLILTKWNPLAIAGLIQAYESALPKGGWPNWVLGNHDQKRLASRVGPGQARIAAMLLLTLRGTPTIYQGEELGMTDVPIPPELVQDPFEKNVPGLGLGRDPERTPMPWNASAGAGFSTATPWLPLGPDAGTVNVAAEAADPHSMLTLYRALLALRRAEPALSVGTYQMCTTTDAMLCYRRQHGGRTLRVILNFSRHPIAVEAMPGASVLLATGLDQAAGSAVPGELRAGEGLVVAMP